VVAGIVDLGHRFRLVLNEVDLVVPDAPLPRLSVARAVWRPRPDLRTAAHAWLMAGGPHHTALTQALDTEALDDLAEIAGIELLVIDADTRLRAFRNELRWNEAASRVAGGS
jgi:L-arabinose isomerase